MSREVPANLVETDAVRLKAGDNDIFAGAVVWAKLGDMWWPAIVTEMYTLILRLEFVDDSCQMEGWATECQLLKFTGIERSIDGEIYSDGVDWSSQLERAVDLALEAIYKGTTLGDRKIRCMHFNNDLEKEMSLYHKIATQQYRVKQALYIAYARWVIQHDHQYT